MKAVQKIELPQWVKTPEVQDLVDVLGGGDLTKLVGGCVRNALMGVGESDIDLATKLEPEEAMERCKVAGFKVIPTGLKHGTITVVINGKPFEVTTLRQDVETYGRHAEVAYTYDWIADAKRRDFTMNTLLADLDGNVYDPLGAGIDDLNKRAVKFVGEPAERIREDYLRILRFFRFHAYYGEGDTDEQALRACSDLSENISSLSRERITQEFLKILSVDSAAENLKIVFDNNVLIDIAHKNYQENILSDLCKLQHINDAVNIVARLFVLAGCRPSTYEGQLKLTHKQIKFIIKLEMIFSPELYGDEKSLKRAIFHHGNELVLQGYLLNVACGQVEAQKSMIEFAKNWQAPECPITGESLLAQGFETGPALGQELARRQEEWLEEILED